jgi:hypothetical protein
MSSPYSASNSRPLGVALLRLSPLAISSASLMFSWAQNVLFSSFLDQPLRDDLGHPTGKILPRYLSAFMRKGLKGIGLTYPTATILCIANGLRGQSRDVRRLYLAGAVLSLAHFCWGPKMFGLLRRIGDPKTAAVVNEEALAAWLPAHQTRTLLVNIPAFLCILGATVGVLAEGI